MCVHGSDGCRFLFFSFSILSKYFFMLIMVDIKKKVRAIKGILLKKYCIEILNRVLKW